MAEPEAAEGRQEVAVLLTLDKDFDEVSQGSARRAFEVRAKRDISRTLGIDKQQVIIKGLRAGSVILDCSITGLSVSTGSAADFCQELLTDKDVVIADSFVLGVISRNLEPGEDKLEPEPEPEPEPQPKLEPEPGPGRLYRGKLQTPFECSPGIVKLGRSGFLNRRNHDE